MNRGHILATCIGLGALTACEERVDGLGPGLASSDRTRPAVVSTSPFNQSTQVSPTASISVTFSEPMRPTSLSAGSISFSPAVAGAVTYAGNTATFRPSFSLAPNTIYTGTVATAAEDLAGNNLESPFSWTFTTGTPALLDR
jgi:hypothetical protein